MKILAIETSGKTFSVAASENKSLLYEIFYNKGLVHSEMLIPSIKKILKHAGWNVKDIDKIAVSTGPGSFTGIRVGLSCARMLAQSLEVGIVGVNTLDILLEAVPKGDYLVCPAIDALRNDVFVKHKTDIIIKPVKDFLKDLKRFKSKVLIVGNASISYSMEIRKVLGKNAVLCPEDIIYPRAKTLALMSENIQPQKYNYIKPLYIRKSYAEEKK